MVNYFKGSSKESELFNLLFECVKDKLLAEKSRQLTYTRVKDPTIRKTMNRGTEGGKSPGFERDSYSSSPRLSEPTFR